MSVNEMRILLSFLALFDLEELNRVLYLINYQDLPPSPRPHENRIIKVHTSFAPSLPCHQHTSPRCLH